MSDILTNLAKEVDNLPAEQPSDDSTKASVSEETVDEEQVDSPMSKLLSGKVAVFPQVGDLVEGEVIEVSSNEIYLNLNPFGTGIVMGKEIKNGMGGNKLMSGDKISATVIDLENDEGFIELSIREASHEKAWDDLESKRDTQEKIATRILSANKGGLMVELNGITGFLPVSQLSSKNYPRVEDGDKNKILTLLKKLIGQEMEVRIIDTNRENEKLIVSEKAAQSEKDKESISKLDVSDVIEGEISGVVDFGAFIKFLPKGAKNDSEEEKLEGLVHISEMAWQLIENPRNIVKVGDKVKAQIIGIDEDKISLSIRALQEDPWSVIDKKFKIGDVVKGVVNKINHFGAFVYLDKDIHGLAHISEMFELYPGKSLEDIISVGQEYSWKILSMEPKDHRMGLALVKDTKKAKVEKKAKEPEEKKGTEKKEAKKKKKEE